MTKKRFWCLAEYEGETSPIIDGKFAPTNRWLCNRLNKLYEENKQLKQSNQEAIELIYDGIVELHDGKRDYAETLFNKAIEIIAD